MVSIVRWSLGKIVGKGVLKSGSWGSKREKGEFCIQDGCLEKSDLIRLAELTILTLYFQVFMLNLNPELCDSLSSYLSETLEYRKGLILNSNTTSSINDNINRRINWKIQTVTPTEILTVISVAIQTR